MGKTDEESIAVMRRIPLDSLCVTIGDVEMPDTEKQRSMRTEIDL